jgi:hypothetical protein
MSRYKEIDIHKVRSVSVKARPSKFHARRMARPVKKGDTFSTFWESLPDVLAGEEIRQVVRAVCDAREKKKPVLFMMGAHVIKVGLSPVLIDLMEHGVIQGLALNGAGAIHDMELAYFGKTSEDVAASIDDGSFGMAEETAALLNDTVRTGRDSALGFGEALGKRVREENPEYASLSILGQAYSRNIPATVHVALGTDIVHQHPGADGGAIGEASLRDFRIFCRMVSGLGEGGVALLFGSSVVLPEVFLKALTTARNIHGSISNFTTACFDMLRHYRPLVNVIQRPTQSGGRGISITGHHEIMIPLLAAAIKEQLR